MITYDEWKREQLNQDDQPYMTVDEFNDYLEQENILADNVASFNTNGTSYGKLINYDYIWVADCTCFIPVNEIDFKDAYNELLEQGEL